MSQHWHGHWIEHAFAPHRLRNWEIPKLYPMWPSVHSTTTQFQANDKGHITDPKHKSKCSPWGNYKGTWDLPNKITRQVVEGLVNVFQPKDVYKGAQKTKCRPCSLRVSATSKARKDTEIQKSAKYQDNRRPTGTKRTDKTTTPLDSKE